MFFKKNFDSERIYTVRPYHFSTSFIKLLHLLSDETILLTFDERDVIYKHVDFIIKFLEEKKENEKDNIGG